MYRYQAVLMRARFDLNRNERDFRKAQDLLSGGEQELFEKQHTQPRKCKK